MKRIRIIIAALMLSLAGGVMADARSAVDNKPADIEQQASVKTSNGALTIDNTTDHQIDVAVFAITGTLVHHRQLNPGENIHLELPAGYYIVKAGDTSKRVAVK